MGFNSGFKGLTLKITRLGKLYWTGNVVISKVVTLMYVVLSKPERHMPCEQIVDTTECITL